MRRVMFLFPGQGAKRADAALRAAVRAPEGRALCEVAARAAGLDLARLLARPSLLDRTEVYQPVITAVALAAARALAAAGIAPAVVLGHSLGEVAAWSAAGCIPAEAAVELAAARGRLMAREAAAHPGGMVALATAEEPLIEAALAAGRSAGALDVAARNAPDETVLTGDEAAVRAVLAFAPAVATRLPTPGAWHSPAMAGALDEWRAALRAVDRAEPRCAFVANRTGDVVASGYEIPDLLAEQLVRPVAWTQALATAAAGARALVTLGPGAVLRSLWHRNTGRGNARTIPVLATEDERSLAETVATWREDATEPRQATTAP
jgi:[acyl-carrier-protein] S-malonyltransferase